MPATRGVPTVVQYVLLALVWGASFLFMKVGLEGLSPGQVVLARLSIGALTLLAVCATGRQPLPRQRSVWANLLVVALLLCVVPFLLFTTAEQHVSSGLASIYNATTPLMTLAVSLLALPSESRSRDRVVGLVLGFAGVVILMAPWQGQPGGSLGGQLACLGATACYGLGFIWLRLKVTPLGLPATSVACVQLLLGALVMLLLTPVLATGPVHLSARVVVSMLVLGGLGTGLAYVWNTNVVTRWGAANASTVTYLTPVVGVVLGVLLLHEHFTWTEPLGALVVILGIAASQGRLHGRRRAQAG